MNVRDLVNGSHSSGRAYTTKPLPVRRQSHRRKADTMLESASVPPSRAGSPSLAYSRDASLVLIGMRGVGKTTLASIAAKALGWAYIDLDSVFESQQKTNIYGYITQHGWDAFRQVESTILVEALRQNSTRAVIACGGGVVELQQNRAVLQSFRERGLVIHVLREKDIVLKFISESTHFPPYAHETAVEAWDRREVLFRDCCSFEFISLTVPVPPNPVESKETVTQEQILALKPVQDDFFRLLRFIHGVDINKVSLYPRGPRTYFLALTFEDVRQAVPIIEDISLGVDMWELRIDLLASLDPTFLSFQVATLRRHSKLPILFTLRTVTQGGKYPDVTDDPASVAALADILRHAMRLGVEYLDLELTFPKQLLSETVANKGHTTIIGSFHDWKGSIWWTGTEMRHIYDSIARMGVDIIKIVNTAKSFEDNMSLRQFASSVERNPTPLLAINMGNEGKISRVLNPILSPVSHPSLPKASAPGQISYFESQSILHLIGLLPAKNYYLFGTPVAHSMSPAMHRTSFSVLGLPHAYDLMDTESLDTIAETMKSANFGGASVTIPHKRTILSLLQHVSRHARLIGAVNTIVPMTNGGFAGDNTDWRAIKTCLMKSISPDNLVTSSTTALVIGSGGTTRATIYALHNIGVVNIFLYNRTRAAAEVLAQEFGRLDTLLRIRVLDNLDIPLPIHPAPTIIVSTIPATDSRAAGQLIDIGLKAEHFSAAGGVAMELAYEARTTPLLAIAAERRAAGVAWVGVEGIEILLEQGYEQCRLWTGRRAPWRQVREKVLSVYDEAIANGTRGNKE